MLKSISKDDLNSNFPNVFADGMSTIKEPPVSIYLKNDAKSVFLKSWPVSLALRKETYLELERLRKEGI